MSSAPNQQFSLPRPSYERVRIPGFTPYYETPVGAAYLQGALDLLRALPSDSVNTIITSPPYALHFKKEYGNVDKKDYVNWFLPFAQEFFWFNPAKLPMPAEWVTVRRSRVKDAVEHVWWLSKTPWPKASNRNVLRPYSGDMLRLNQRASGPQSVLQDT